MATDRSLPPLADPPAPGPGPQSDPLDRGRPRPALAPTLAERWGALAGGRLGVRTAAAAVAGVVVLVGAGWWLLRPAPAPLESVIPLASTATTSVDGGPGAGEPVGAGSAPTGGVPGGGPTTTVVATEVVVQAAGAVARPGVYRLPVAARVDDLVREAGGLAGDADGDRVNLAAPLADGERVWIPRRGEETAPDVVAGGGTGTAPSVGGGGGSGGPVGPATPAAPVDLNTATAEQLDTLPGVGPSTAQAILTYRDQQGRFVPVDELLEVRGIGEAKLEQLRPVVTV